MNDSYDTRFNAQLRTLQIIASALLLGVLFFLGIVLVLQHGQGLNQQAGTLVLSYVALALLASILIVWSFLPNQLANGQVRKIADGSWTPGPEDSTYSRSPVNPESLLAAFPTDADKLLAVFQTTSIVGWALLEGSALLGCVAYLLEAQPFVFAVIGVPVLLFVVTFPMRGRVTRWLEEQQRRVKDIRQSEGLPE
jgi:hypothetical protein